MAIGDVTVQYAASSNLVVTNLHSLPASATWVAGWESAVIDAAGLEDYAVTGKLVTASANRQAGEIRVYAVPMLDDATYIDTLDGTESVETITTTGILGAAAQHIATCVVTNANGEV